jgi:ubiquinone/menaquinone biosynthesis C-methylase UbiE
VRKTYRSKGVKEYWTARWDALEADMPMKNVSKYPLSCSLDTLKNTRLESAKILEAGCGTGRLLRYFHELGCDITGVDFIEGAIKKIQELSLGLKAEVGDITGLKFQDCSFTHVLAFGLYHNFEEEMIEKALEETYRVMKQKGVLCASFRADNLQNFLNDKYFSHGLASNDTDEQKRSFKGEFHKINLT